MIEEKLKITNFVKTTLVESKIVPGIVLNTVGVIICPKCEADVIKADDAKLGGDFTCPECSTTLTISASNKGFSGNIQWIFSNMTVTYDPKKDNRSLFSKVFHNFRTWWS